MPDDDLAILANESATSAARALGWTVHQVYRVRRRLGMRAPRETRHCVVCGREFVAHLHRRHLSCGPECAREREARRVLGETFA